MSKSDLAVASGTIANFCLRYAVRALSSPSASGRRGIR